MPSNQWQKRNLGVQSSLDFSIAIKILWARVNNHFTEKEGGWVGRVASTEVEFSTCLWGQAKDAETTQRWQKGALPVGLILFPSFPSFLQRQERLCAVGQWLISLSLMKPCEDLCQDGVSKWELYKASDVMGTIASVTEDDLLLLVIPALNLPASFSIVTDEMTQKYRSWFRQKSGKTSATQGHCLNSCYLQQAV